MQVIDPAGKARGAVQSDATHEDILGIAWGLGPRDSFVVVLTDADTWELMVYRAGRVPVTAPLGVRTTHPKEQPKATMIEAAGLDLVDEGLAVASAAGK